jgi:adenylate cyclase
MGRPVSKEGVERKLTTVLAADVVGYSRLMGADEVGTLARLKSLRKELVQPKIAEGRGRIVKLMGDGLLAEFPSVVEAVRCAVAIQQDMAGREADLSDERRIRLRIGVNLGDIIVEGSDIYGDGVNVAARLEGLAEPGGICISGKVYEEVRTKLATAFEDLGEQEVKNIREPVRVYRWTDAAPNPMPATEGAEDALALPDKPSIVVLPFDNLSTDPEQAYFVDGVVEDLITALSRFPWLYVIARNSSFAYKGRPVQAKQVSQELGVRYLVEGSVRSSPTRLRVTAQLIDATNGHHVWAEKYDRPTGDLFDLQDEICQAIIGVLVPALSSAERERSLRSNRPGLDAWQAYQKGLAYYYRPYSDANHAEARRMFDRAIELDESFADAYVMIALMGIYALDSGQSSYTGTAEEILAEAAQAAKLAVQLEDNNALAHTVLGRIYDLQFDGKAGVAECETAIGLNPNLAIAHHELGFVLNSVGR